MISVLITSALLSPSQVYAEIAPYVPQSETVLICAEVEPGEPNCQTFLPDRQIHLEAKGSAGEGDTAQVIGAIMHAASHSTGAGGHVAVSFSTSTTKKDGSSEKTDIKVDVTVGVGSAAEPAASK